LSSLFLAVDLFPTMSDTLILVRLPYYINSTTTKMNSTPIKLFSERLEMLANECIETDSPDTQQLQQIIDEQEKELSIMKKKIGMPSSPRLP
jgi:hypothetical protein